MGTLKWYGFLNDLNIDVACFVEANGHEKFMKSDKICDVLILYMLILTVVYT